MHEVNGSKKEDSKILYEPTTSLPYCFTLDPFKHFIRSFYAK